MKEQHPSWKGIVPYFESGREYLDWIQNWMEWGGTVPEEYEAYFLELGNAVRHHGYEHPVSEKKMCRALERSQRTGEMIDIVPDPEFLPGGASEGQCDGWTYHIEFLPKEAYFKARQEEEELERAVHFIHRVEWHFAKTMPQIPHWYCLLKECEDKEEFLWFARYIVQHRVPGEFYGRTYRYCYLGKYKYWMMDESPEDCDLINRDEVPEQEGIYFSHYSFILTGSLEKVKEIFSRHDAPLCKSDFHKDTGYVFIVPEKGVGHSGLVTALEECPEITALRFGYGTTIDAYLAMCEQSLVPVDIPHCLKRNKV